MGNACFSKRRWEKLRKYMKISPIRPHNANCGAAGGFQSSAIANVKIEKKFPKIELSRGSG
jgi:hypothetical protein